jgi:hypothetical protein
MINLSDCREWEKFFAAGFSSIGDFRKALAGDSRLVKRVLEKNGFQSGKITLPLLGAVKLGKNEFYITEEVEDAKDAYYSLKDFLDKSFEDEEDYYYMEGFYNKVELINSKGKKDATFNLVIVQHMKDYERYLNALFHLNKMFLAKR